MNRTQASRSGWAYGRAAVAIRQVHPEQDLPALSNFFAGLSTHSRYLRFFGPVTPGAALLRTLAGFVPITSTPWSRSGAASSWGTPWPWTGSSPRAPGAPG